MLPSWRVLILGYFLSFVSWLPLLYAVEIPVDNYCLPSNSIGFRADSADAFIDKISHTAYITVEGTLEEEITDFNLTTGYLTTLGLSSTLLQYSLYSNYTRFCDDFDCPLLPSQNLSLQFSIPFDSNYQLCDVYSELDIIASDFDGTIIGCLRVSLSQVFNPAVSNTITWVPIAIWLAVAASTIFVLIANPWTGSTNFFEWNMNFGKDVDAIRLVTPGPIDLLRFFQYGLLMAGLGLDYPIYYRPLWAKFAWASLLLPHGFVSGSKFQQIDNVYFADASNSLGMTAQFAGLMTEADVWPTFIVWLLVFLGGFILMLLVYCACSTAYSKLRPETEVDLRPKAFPATCGLILRFFLDAFLMPYVAFAFFQFVVTTSHYAYSTALAAISLLLLVALGTVVFFILWRSNNWSEIYQHDLTTMLYVGPLINTYRPEACLFVIFEFIYTFCRGIVFGAGQASGAAQIGVLSGIEVCYLCVLSLWLPYPSDTGMNFISAVSCFLRIAWLMFSVAFIPSVKASPTVKGWISYVLLVCCCVVLLCFIGFCLHRLIEVTTRLTIYSLRTDRSVSLGLRQLTKRRTKTRSTALAIPNEYDKSQRHWPGSSADLQETNGGGTDYENNNDISYHSPVLNRSFNFFREPRVVVNPEDDEDTTSRDNNTDSFETKARTNEDYYSDPTTATMYNDDIYRPFKHISSFDNPSYSSLTNADSSDNNQQYPTPSSSLLHQAQMKQTGIPVDPTTHPHREPTVSSLFKKPNDYSSREADVYYRARKTPLSGTAAPRNFGTGPADPTGVRAGIRGWAAKLISKKKPQREFQVIRSMPLRTLNEEQQPNPPRQPLEDQDLLVPEEDNNNHPQMLGGINKHISDNSSLNNQPRNFSTRSRSPIFAQHPNPRALGPSLMTQSINASGSLVSLQDPEIHLEPSTTQSTAEYHDFPETTTTMVRRPPVGDNFNNHHYNREFGQDDGISNRPSQTSLSTNVQRSGSGASMASSASSGFLLSSLNVSAPSSTNAVSHVSGSSPPVLSDMHPPPISTSQARGSDSSISVPSSSRRRRTGPILPSGFTSVKTVARGVVSDAVRTASGASLPEGDDKSSDTSGEPHAR